MEEGNLECVAVGFSGLGVAGGRSWGTGLGDDARVSRVGGLSLSPIAFSSFSFRMVFIRANIPSAVSCKNLTWASE